MSPEDGDVYVMSEGEDGEEWVSPIPVDIAVTDAVCGATDLEEADLDDVDAYVDVEDLRAVLEDGEGEAVSFNVEGHRVTVHADGSIDVE